MRSPSAFGSKAHSVLPPLPECKSPRLSACDGCNRHDVLCTRQHTLALAGSSESSQVHASPPLSPPSPVSPVVRRTQAGAHETQLLRDKVSGRPVRLEPREYPRTNALSRCSGLRLSW